MTIINIALPKKICLYELEPLKCILSKLYKYTYLKCIFTIQRVQKIENAMKWAKHLDI